MLSGQSLFLESCNDIKALLALVGNVCPVASSNLVLREELRTHAYAVNASVEPLLQVVSIGRNATGNHNLRPRHWSEQTLHEVWTYNITWEDLGELAAEFLSLADLGRSYTTWAVAYATTIADRSNIRIEERTYNEASAELDIESSCRSVNYRTNAKSQFGAFLGSPLVELAEYLMCKVATIGELESTNTTFVASLYDILANLDILVVEYRNHWCGTDLGHHLKLIKSCHDINEWKSY